MDSKAFDHSDDDVLLLPYAGSRKNNRMGEGLLDQIQVIKPRRDDKKFQSMCELPIIKFNESTLNEESKDNVEGEKDDSGEYEDVSNDENEKSEWFESALT